MVLGILSTAVGKRTQSGRCSVPSSSSDHVGFGRGPKRAGASSVSAVFACRARSCASARSRSSRCSTARAVRAARSCRPNRDAEPVGRFDRPRMFANCAATRAVRRAGRVARAHPHGRARPRRHPPPPPCATARADRRRSPRSSKRAPETSRDENAVGTPDYGGSYASHLLSSRTTARSGDLTTSFVSQTRSRDGRHFESRPTELRRSGRSQRRTRVLNQAVLCGVHASLSGSLRS